MDKTKKIEFQPASETPRNPLDLWKLMGGKTRRVAGDGLPVKDSLLAVYKGRLTFTFILGDEVASIHFDQTRREIYFKGHNIRNFKLTSAQMQALHGLKDVLKGDERGKELLADYEATLATRLAENK